MNSPPYIGIGIFAVELAAALTVFGTALFGSRELSERAFRLLRWVANGPEPPTPGTARSTPGGGRSPG